MRSLYNDIKFCFFLGNFSIHMDKKKVFIFSNRLGNQLTIDDFCENVPRAFPVYDGVEFMVARRDLKIRVAFKRCPKKTCVYW